jgi:hypothetical protein
MKPLVTMRSALKDHTLLGYALAADSRLGWRTLLIAMMGEELTAAERITFKELTQLDYEPGIRAEEFIGIVGRRGGKSRAIRVLACYAATLCDYSDNLVPGEIGVLLIIAPDQRQAGIILSYISATLEASERLKRLIRTKTGDTVALTNGMLALISSPYAKRGILWAMHKHYFGPTNPDRKVIIAQGASRTVNPSLSSGVVNRAMERDPVRGPRRMAWSISR